MKSINPLVKAALADCGVPAFFHAWQPGMPAYPSPPETYITYFEMLTQAEIEADDAPFVNGRYVRVSAWSTADTAPVAAKVRAGMRGAGFILRQARDIFEPDTRTYHWASDWVLYQNEESEG